MKKFLIILLMSIGFSFSGFSQEGEKPQADGGKLKAYQIAYLTDRLKLKPEEAQRFWPVFNQYQDEIRKVRIEGRNLPEVDKEQKIVDIRKKYFEEFTKVLNKDRADRVFKADNEFRDLIRKEIQERRQLKQDRRGLKQ
ncbi:MAG TPA: hypothetical protein VEV87_02125 [Chitinophagaceae bacterium]|nr:hypothetical protein [Chitinophagaceae bacterium]